MEYHEYPPPDALASIVHCFWTLRADHGAGVPEPALPDGHPELIVNLGDPFVALDGDGRRVLQPLVMLVGQITHPFAVAPTGAVHLVAARCAPGGAAVLQRPMAALTDGWRDLSELLPGVRDGGTTERVHADLAARLFSLAQAGRAPSQVVTEATALIARSHGAMTTSEVAAVVGTNVRKLQRLFREEVGVGPKFLARLRRFQRVLACWREAPGDWARVAVACGYFDQAHLIRDFTELGGGAPAALLAEMSQFTRLFMPKAHPASAQDR